MDEISEKPELVNAGNLISENLPEPVMISPPSEQAAPAPVATPLPALITAPAVPVTASELIEKRGRGRPKGSKNKKEGEQVFPSLQIPGTVADDLPAPGEVAQPIQPPGNYALLAELTFDTGTRSLAIMFGDEWLPGSPEEKTMVCGALSKYYEVKQFQDIPPGMLLAVVLISYGANRIRQPKTSAKISAAWTWFKGKLGKKRRLPANPIDNGAMP